MENWAFVGRGGLVLLDAAVLKTLLSGHVKQSPESLRCVLPSGDGLEAAEEGEGKDGRDHHACRQLHFSQQRCLG